MNEMTEVLGIVAMEPKGDYDASTYYEKLNTVLYNDSTYMAKEGVVGEDPSTSSKWQLIGGGVRREDIVDNLDSNDATKMLSAKQGKVLNEGKVQVFDTVALMKSANLKNGMTAQTLGYYAVNDGGGATYKITNTQSNSEYQEELDNGLYATLIVKENTVNIKQLGAVGNGTDDDSVHFRKAIGKYKNVEVPIGNYLFETSVVLTGYDINFYGIPVISPNVLASERSIITSQNGYAFTIGWGKVNNFSHLSFVGYGLDTPTSSVVENCMFQGKTGMRNTRMLQVDKCMFRDMETGIEGMTDSVVTNCVFNPCSVVAINLTNSNDNRILNTRITWNELGIKIDGGNYNNISNNIFDRNTTYGIEISNASWNIISNNIFERNLENHIKGKIYYSNINGNLFMAKNSLDDQSGTVVPTVVFDTSNIKGCTFNGNSFINSDTLFKNNSVNWEDNSWSGNAFNNKPLEGDLVNLDSITVTANSTYTLNITWSNLDYLGIRPFDMDIEYVKLYKSPLAVFSGDGRIIRVDKNNNTGLFIEIKNDTASDVNWDVYVKLKVINPRYASV